MQEAFAEKVRAALTRVESPIRDFYPPPQKTTPAMPRVDECVHPASADLLEYLRRVLIGTTPVLPGWGSMIWIMPRGISTSTWRSKTAELASKIVEAIAGRGTTCIKLLKRDDLRRLPMRLKTSEKIRSCQRKLYLKAKQEPS